MAVKIFIKRTIPEDKIKDALPLFRKLRGIATNSPGYISGETLRRVDKHNEYLVISSWHSAEDWEKWIANKERKEIQEQLESLLEEKTEYTMYHYGFRE